MTSLALTLTLIAAVLHAAWNISLKRSRDRVAFAALLLLSAGAVLAPWTVPWAISGAVPRGVWLLLAISVAAETGYYACLVGGYQRGELSLVYPITRGTGAMLTAITGRAVLGERPTIAGAAGIALVAGGLLLIGILSARRTRSSDGAVAFSLAAGVCISIYSVTDKTAVSQTAVLPFMGGMFLLTGVAIALFSLAVAKASAVDEWRTNWRSAIGAGLISAVTYGLVLTAMTMTHVGYVAAVRESSMLFALLLAWARLGEEPDRHRTAGALLMVAGVAMIGLGG